MDTFREKQLLEDMYSRGQVPWEVWKQRPQPRSQVHPHPEMATR
jgi:hypothetical protein